MSHAAQAYARTSQATANPREIEAQALLMAARKLQDVQTNWTGPDQNLHKALLFNRRLWSIFMTAVEANDNPQPVEFVRTSPISAISSCSGRSTCNSIRIRRN